MKTDNKTSNRRSDQCCFLRRHLRMELIDTLHAFTLGDNRDVFDWPLSAESSAVSRRGALQLSSLARSSPGTFNGKINVGQ